MLLYAMYNKRSISVLRASWNGGLTHRPRAGQGAVSSSSHINSTIFKTVWQSLGANWPGRVRIQKSLLLLSQQPMVNSAQDLPPWAARPCFGNKSGQCRRKTEPCSDCYSSSLPWGERLEPFRLHFLFVRRAWVKNRPTDRKTDEERTQVEGIFFFSQQRQTLEVCLFAIIN